MEKLKSPERGRNEEQTKHTYLELLWRHKAVVTLGLTVVLLSAIVLDALTNSGRVVRLACGWVPDQWHATLPCPTSRDIETDPRKILVSDMGIGWDEENFWKAVARGDDRAVALFLRGGMGVSSEHLHRLLSDRTAVRRASLRSLIERRSELNTEFCSSDDANGSVETDAVSRSTRRFVEYIKDNLVLEFVKEFCAGKDVISPLKNHLAAESQRLSGLRLENEKNTKSYTSCVRQLSRSEYWDKIVHGVGSIACNFADALDRTFCRVEAKAWDRHLSKICPHGINGCFPANHSYEPVDISAFCGSRYAMKEVDQGRRDALAVAVKAYEQ